MKLYIFTLVIAAACWLLLPLAGVNADHEHDHLDGPGGKLSDVPAIAGLTSAPSSSEPPTA